MSHIATSAQRQKATAQRLAMIAILGCGDADCYTCYPDPTTEIVLTFNEPTVAEMTEANAEFIDAENAAAIRYYESKDDYTNPDVNVVWWE